MLQIITLKIDLDTLIEIDRYAERTGLTRSAVIRLAIRKFLEGQGLAPQDEEPHIKRIKIELPSEGEGEPGESKVKTIRLRV